MGVEWSGELSCVTGTLFMGVEWSGELSCVTGTLFMGVEWSGELSCVTGTLFMGVEWSGELSCVTGTLFMGVEWSGELSCVTGTLFMGVEWSGELSCVTGNGASFGCAGAEVLAKALSPAAGGGLRRSLRILNLSDDGINSPGAEALAAALAPDTVDAHEGALTTLNLLGNLSGENAAVGRAAILAALKRSRTLNSICGLQPGAVDVSFSSPLTTDDMFLLAGELELRGGSLAALDLSLQDVLSPYPPGGYVSEEGCAAVMAALRSAPGLTALTLTCMRLGPEGAAAVARELAHLPALRILRVAHGGEGAAGARLLATAVGAHAALRRFCGVPLRGLREGLITRLHLADAGVGVPGALALSLLVAAGTPLQSLRLDHNGLAGREHAGEPECTAALQALGEALGGSPGLTDLTLRGNCIGPAGAAAFAAGLAHAGRLISLALDENHLAGREKEEEAEEVLGVEALAAAVRGHATLESISLRDSCLGPKCAAALAPSLVGATALHTVDVLGNPLGEQGEAVLLSALRAHGALTSLCGIPPYALAADLSQRGLSAADAALLAGELAGRGSLTALNLLGNRFSPPALEGLLRVFQRSTSLRTLCGLTPFADTVDLSGGKLGPGDAALLSADLGKEGAAAESLRVLNVWGNCGLEVWGAQCLVQAAQRRPEKLWLCGALLDTDDLHLEDNLEPADTVLLAHDLALSVSLTALNLAGLHYVAGVDYDEDDTGVELDYSGLEALAEALKMNGTLETLTLPDDVCLPIGPLRRHELIELDLSSKGLFVGDMLLLAAGLTRSPRIPTLQTLNLSGSALSGKRNVGDVYDPRGIEALAGALAGASALSMLILDNIGLAGGEDEADEHTCGMEVLVAAVRQHSTLTSLSLRDNFLGPKCTAALAAGLAGATTLRALDLSDNYLTVGQLEIMAGGIWNPEELEAGMAALAEALRGNKVLTSLSLRNNRLGPKSALALASALEGGGALRTLDLDSNWMGRFGGEVEADGMAALARALARNSTLTYLSSQDNFLGERFLTDLGPALEVNRTLTGLGLRKNPLVAPDTAAATLSVLGQGLRRNTSLRFLDLSETNIKSDDAAALAVGAAAGEGEYAGALQGGLRILKLSGNWQMGSDPANLMFSHVRDKLQGFEAIGWALAKSAALADLDLGGCRMGPKGAAALAHGLKLSSSLSTLNLAENLIESEGTTAVATCLMPLEASGQFNKTLTTLDLSDCYVCSLRSTCPSNWVPEYYDPAGLEALCEAVALSPSLRTLLLDGNYLAGRRYTTERSPDDTPHEERDEGAAALGRALERNRSLTTLSLCRNALGPMCMASLSSGLAANGTLHHLALDDNELAGRSGDTLLLCTERDEGMKALGKALRENEGLTSVGLAYNVIAAKCAAALASALSANRSLRTVDLR
eukprot:gene14856-17561_t